MHDDGGRGDERPFGTGPRPRQRIRADLERRGVSEALADPLADRLEEFARQLTASEYHAALLATTATCEVMQQGASDLESRCRDVREIQHLMQGFAGELRKLEEGLGIVSAYLVRLRSTADGDPGGHVH
jgi:hypothetical protein